MKKTEKLERITGKMFRELPQEKIALIFGGLITTVSWPTTGHGGDVGQEFD